MMYSAGEEQSRCFRSVQYGSTGTKVVRYSRARTGTAVVAPTIYEIGIEEWSLLLYFILTKDKEQRVEELSLKIQFQDNVSGV